MLQYIKSFTKNYPNITIEIDNPPPAAAIKGLRNDEFDLIIYPNLDLDSEFLAKTFISFDPVLIMKKNHPLAKKKSIELRDIGKFNLVRIEKDSITLPLFNEICDRFKFKSNIVFKEADWEFLKHYVRADMGVAVVSTICIGDDDHDLTYRKLNKYFPTMNYQIVVKRGKYLNGPLREFIGLVDEEFLVKENKNENEIASK